MDTKYPLVNLEDYVFFQEGPGLRTYQWTQTGMKVITIGVVKENGEIDLDFTNKYVSLAEFDQKYKHFSIEEGDVVITTSGVSYGKIGRIRKEHLPMMMNTSLIRFHTNHAELDQNYLFAYLRSQHFREQMDMYALGSAQPNVGPSHLKRMTIILPDIDSQKRIAEIVSSLDSKIELNRQMNQNLEQMAMALYKHWFVDFAPFQDTEFVESELGFIPKGWEAVDLLAFSEILGGGTPKTSVSEYWGGEIPWASVKDLDDTFILQTEKSITQEGVAHSSTRILPTLTSIISARGTVGEISITSQPMAMNQSCYGVHSLIDAPWFTYLSLVNSVQRLKTNSHGTVFSTITRNTLLAERYAFHEGTIRKFEQTVDAWFHSVLSNLSEMMWLKATRDYLLPRLLSGDIELKEGEERVQEVV